MEKIETLDAMQMQLEQAATDPELRNNAAAFAQRYQALAVPSVSTLMADRCVALLQN